MEAVRKKRRRVWGWVLGILIGLVVLDQGLVWWGRQFKVARETTYITSPLSAEGYPDYLAAINEEMSAGVTGGTIPALGGKPITLRLMDGNMKERKRVRME